jgi:hypothetical protein
MDITTLEYILNNLYIQNLILELKKNKQEYSYLENNITSENETINTTTIITETDNNKSEDDYVYKKQWNKLNNIHKIIKLKEYVNNLDINNNEKPLLKNELIKLIKDKTLTKKYSVNYDDINCRIVSIPILQYKDNKYVIV